MRKRNAVLVAAAFATAAIAVAVGLRSFDDSGASGRSEHVASPAGRAPASSSYSNIFAADYTGPAACASCHPDKHNQWSRSLHRAMNQVADSGSVAGQTGSRVLEYGDATVGFERREAGSASQDRGGEYVMTLRRGDRVVRRFRVTRTIGSKSLQEYVGVQLAGPEPEGDSIYQTEIRLPFGFWIDRAAWFPQEYFDSWFGAEYEGRSLARDPLEPDRSPWNARCPWCHNTYPFATRAARAHGDEPRGFGPEQYLALDQAVDAAWKARVVDGNELPIDELVTVGISCESCHFGGRRHVEDSEPMMFWPTSPALRETGQPIPRGGRASSDVKTSICAQCHSAPSPVFPDGSAVRNSREALDLISGACASAITCTDCHDPHVTDSGRGSPDAVCVRCHDHLGTDVSAKAHARHPASIGCADCHMPRIVQGITEVVRSHHISSPGDGGMMGPSMPNACNLCHLDRSTAWTVEQLSARWGVSIVAATSDVPAGQAWLRADGRDTRLIAMDALSRSGPSALIPLLGALDDPVAYDRMRALMAVEAVLGRRLSVDEFDPIAEPKRRAAQAGRLREGR